MSSQQSKTADGRLDARPAALAAAPAAAETPGERLRRRARRARLHVFAYIAVALLVCLVALTVANTRQVKLSWVVGSSTASLVWIVLFSAILGWLLGIVSSALFRWRTRQQPRVRRDGVRGTDL